MGKDGRLNKKKARIIVAIIILFAVLLFPNISQIKDGGSVEYHAVLYQVIKWHRYEGNHDSDKDRLIYYDGTEVRILGITVYSDAQNMIYMYCD